MTRLDLISPAYRAEQGVLHAATRGYGGKGDKWADVVLATAQQYDCWSVLDYGCGQGALARAILMREDRRVLVREYDPAIEGKDGRPMFADLVVCTDVLEHVEPERLDAVLAHLKSLARRAVFVVINTQPSNKTLTDGRNAHLIVESHAWWGERLYAAGFTVIWDLEHTTAKHFAAVLTC